MKPMIIAIKLRAKKTIPNYVPVLRGKGGREKKKKEKEEILPWQIA